jgi:2-desacetyl-2-hydroxyethyl bacteriochlorophyllide A dehydrogenase
MNRQSLYFTAPGCVSIVEEELSPPDPGQVLVQTIFSAISPGSELLFYRGQHPPDISIDATIPALQAKTGYPMKYGYSLVGRVIELGAAVDPAWQDRLVFAFHPHESHFTTRADDLIPLPQGISPEDAVFLPNMETAINLAMDGAPLIGENVVIFGQGVVGLLTAAVLARFPLNRLVTLDRFSNRRQASIEMGTHSSLDPENDRQLKAILPVGADLTYELSGSPAALDQAIAATGYAGRVVVGSWYGSKQAEINLGGYFHRSRIRLMSSQVSTISPYLSARWTKGRRFDVAWQMLQAIQPSRLITRSMPLQMAKTAYQLLDQEPDKYIQILFTYET